MLQDDFGELFGKYIDQLEKEIALYPDETSLWKIAPGILNAGGNLALHLIGNLNYFIGARFGDTGYIRDRDREFSDKDVPRAKILDDLAALKKIIGAVFSRKTQPDFEALFGPNPFGPEHDTLYVMISILAHMNYHIGQINYHRRLLSQ